MTVDLIGKGQGQRFLLPVFDYSFPVKNWFSLDRYNIKK